MGKFQVAMGLSILGILLFMAGSMDILASNYASFGAFAAFLLAGATWAFWPKG